MLVAASAARFFCSSVAWKPVGVRRKVSGRHLLLPSSLFICSSEARRASPERPQSVLPLPAISPSCSSPPSIGGCPATRVCTIEPPPGCGSRNAGGTGRDEGMQERRRSSRSSLSMLSTEPRRAATFLTVKRSSASKPAFCAALAARLIRSAADWPVSTSSSSSVALSSVSLRFSQSSRISSSDISRETSFCDRLAAAASSSSSVSSGLKSSTLSLRTRRKPALEPSASRSAAVLSDGAGIRIALGMWPGLSLRVSNEGAGIAIALGMQPCRITLVSLDGAGSRMSPGRATDMLRAPGALGCPVRGSGGSGGGGFCSASAALRRSSFSSANAEIAFTSVATSSVAFFSCGRVREDEG